jgi:hypothetical protein
MDRRPERVNIHGLARTIIRCSGSYSGEDFFMRISIIAHACAGALIATAA